MNQYVIDAIKDIAFLFFMLGWVPILAIGKAASWITFAKYSGLAELEETKDNVKKKENEIDD